MVWKYLYYSIGSVDHLPQTVLLQIEACGVASGIVGTVVGVVFQNFAAALATFKALFMKCITDALEEDLGCLVPDLFVVTQAEQWSDL